MSHTLDSKGAYTQAATSDSALCVDDDPLIDSPLIDSPLISQDALESVIRREFKTIPTLWPAVLLCLVHVAYVTLSVTVVVLCVFDTDDVTRRHCASVLRDVSGGSAVVYGKTCLWVLVLFFNACVRHHHSKARRRGYLSFYRHTQGLNRLPFTIHSTGNVALLLLVNAKLSPSRLSDELFGIMLVIILLLELVLVVPCLIYYMVRVVRFNRERAVPDVSHEEHSHAHSSGTNLTMETGFREGSNLEEVVEKQADLIEYLKQHNTQLSRRLLNLTAQH